MSKIYIPRIVSFETAKLAKKKGFDLKVAYTHVMYTDDGTTTEEPYLSKLVKEPTILAPPQSLLHQWLREVHGYHAVIIPTVTCCWTYKVIKEVSNSENIEEPPYKDVCGQDFLTYEDALESALQEILTKLI